MLAAAAGVVSSAPVVEEVYAANQSSRHEGTSTWDLVEPPGWAVGDVMVVTIARASNQQPTPPTGWTQQAFYSSDADMGVVAYERTLDGTESWPVEFGAVADEPGTWHWSVLRNVGSITYGGAAFGSGNPRTATIPVGPHEIAYAVWVQDDDTGIDDWMDEPWVRDRATNDSHGADYTYWRHRAATGGTDYPDATVTISGGGTTGRHKDLLWWRAAA